MRRLTLIFSLLLLLVVANAKTSTSSNGKETALSSLDLATDLWWTGNGDGSSWSDAGNWSTTDPTISTSAAISPPSPATNTYFVGASFPNPQNYTINISTLANCLSFDVSSLGSANSVTFAGAGTLNVYGSYTLTAGLNLNNTGEVVFRSSAVGQTITMAGNEIKGNFTFDGVGGEWTLQDDIQFTGINFGQLNIKNGSLITNNKSISVGKFISTSGNVTRKVDLGSSTLTIKHINFTVTGTFESFIADAATLNFQSSVPEVILNLNATDNDNSIIFKQLNSSAEIKILTGPDVQFKETNILHSNLKILSNVNFGILSMDLGQDITLYNRILTIDTLILNSACESFITIQNGSINFTSAPSFVENLWLFSVKAYVNSTPAAPYIIANNSRESGICQYWNITTNPNGRSLYWIGNANSSNWFDPTNWSLSSGGAPLSASDCYPTIIDNVFFDSNSFNADGQKLDITNTSYPNKEAWCNNMTWQGLDQNNIDWIGSSSLNLGGDLTLDPNMVKNIAYNQTINLWDGIEGRLDFQSGADNRRMKETKIYVNNYTYYIQVSDTIEVKTVQMRRNITGHLNLNGNVLHAQSFTHPGWVDMKDAHMILDGGLAVYYSFTKLDYNSNSHIYVTNNTQFRFSNNWFPSITFYGTLLDNSNLKVDGNLTMHKNTLFNSNLQVTDTLYLKAGQTYTFKGMSSTSSVDLGAITSIAQTCGEGMVIKSNNGSQVRLNMPPNGVNASYATISDINYYTGGSLQLAGNNNVDGGNNTNLNFGGSSAQSFYWRPKQSNGSFSGNWNDPGHWALSPSEQYGQQDPNGCIPSAIDNVIFDAASGDGAAHTINITESTLVNDMTWVEEGGANDVPFGMTLNIDNNFSVSGDISLSSKMAVLNTPASRVFLISTDTAFLDFRNIPLGQYLDFSNGVFILKSPINGSHVTLNSGVLDLNKNDCSFISFFSRNTSNRTFIIKDVNLTITGQRLTGAFSGSPKSSWATNPSSNLDLQSAGSTIKITSPLNDNYFYGGGLTFNKVDYAPWNGDINTIHVSGTNTFTEGLFISGASIFEHSFTTKVLDLTTNKNNVFPAGDTTYFLADGNLQKNGDLNQFLNLISSATGNLHYFTKANGGNVYVCNISVLDIKAIGVPFKTNDVSTYNGAAGSSANPPTGSSWNFNSNSSSAEIAMIDLLDIHANLGDSISVNYIISNNDTGPFKLTYLDENNNTVNSQILSSGNPTTNGDIQIGITNSASITITDFKYYDCPGTFLPGTIGDAVSLIKMPPVSTGIAIDGASEDYLLKNLNSYVYIMDGADRSNLASYNTRKTQVAINDFSATGDSDSLKLVTVNTSIDATELASNDGLNLKRHWTFSNTGADTDAKVKFFFTEGELQSLKTAANITVSDMDFLNLLSLNKYPAGSSPTATTGTSQQILSVGMASEVGSTIFFVESLINGFSGNYFLSSPVPCTIVALAPENGTVIADQTCVKNGWTYYYNNDNPNNALFAIEHTPVGGNTNPFTANVTLTVNENPTAASGIYKVVDNVNKEGNFSIGRYWNVAVTSGSLNGPVNVRFYYNDAELAIAQSQASDFANSTSPTLEISQPISFKTVGVSYTPALLTATSLSSGSVVEFPNLPPATEDGITYVQMEGITSFSGGGITYRVSPLPSPTLPVELTSFTSKVENCNGIIEWETASEKSFSHFLLERSTDAIQFTKIASIVAVGGVNTQAYSFIDEQLEGSSYYRLTMVDLDGKTEQSNVVFAQTDCEENNADVEVFPNPVSQSGMINVRYFTNQQIASITIFDIYGGIAKYVKIASNQGWNTESIDVSDLTAASYYILVESGNKVYKSAQFFKAN